MTHNDLGIYISSTPYISHLTPSLSTAKSANDNIHVPAIVDSPALISSQSAWRIQSGVSVGQLAEFFAVKAGSTRHFEC